MSNELIKSEDKAMEYIPFGAQDKIKLSVSLVRNLIAVKTKSGKTCSEQDAMKFLMMCQARRLNPYEGDAFLIGYDGKDGPSFSLITAHQAFLKRAELNPEYDGMKSGIIVEEDGELKDLEGDFYTTKQKPVGGWATVFFKNRKQPMHKRVRLQRFQKAWGIWQDDPAGMICKCAEADALRSSFPTMLGGLYLKEEMAREADIPSKPIFTAPIIEVAPAAESVAEQESPAKAAMAEPVDKTEPIQILRSTKKKEQVLSTTVDKIKELLAGSELTEKQLTGFLNDIGVIEGIKTLEEIAEQHKDVAEMVISQWADISARIKA